jgi:outer membrane protein assembly factor BamB
MFAAGLLLALSSPVIQAGDWPSAGGPNNTYVVESRTSDAPSSFSVARNENILWSMDLPEGGQSGIAVVGDKIFLTVLKPVTEEEWQKNQRRCKARRDIVGLCIDAKTRTILWQKELKGSAAGPSLYSFSDASTPTPMADEKHVWFYAASGAIACLDHSGKVQWEYQWKPITKLDKVGFPFNKQYEPLMSGDLVYNVEPYYEKDGKRTYGWNHVFAYDKLTGKRQWVSEGALTHYNTPFISQTFKGGDGILIGRGGHHRVPEKPIGYSMIDAQTGKSLWEYADNVHSLYNASFNDQYAIRMSEKSHVCLLDPKDGKLLKKISLLENVDALIYDSEKKELVQHKNIDLGKDKKMNVFPAWFSNLLMGDKLFFMCFESGRHNKRAGPKHSFGRVDLVTGKVEYLQVPTTMTGDTKTYNQSILSDTTNHLGLDLAGDARSKRDGWHWLFNGNPIAVNGKIYYTLMNGRVYVFDATTERFDQSALLSVSDLGVAGKTWSLNTPSFAGGRLYHRTLKQLICIGKKVPK